MTVNPKKNYYYGLGRRKSATARARLFKGKGKIEINSIDAPQFVDGNESLLWQLFRPLQTVSKNNEFDITIKVSGGGVHGQIGACQLAISNALASMSDDLRTTLKKAGYLKRDPREKERKKYGLKRARKKEQFSKR